MRAITTSELLKVWEYSLQHSQTDSSIALLKSASSKNDVDPSVLSIGQRDVRLLWLREWMFGSKLHNTAICPNCNQKVEWENDVKDFKLQSISDAKYLHRYELRADEFVIGYRLPVSKDMLQLKKSNTKEENVKTILHQCILDVVKNNNNCNVEDLPGYVLEAIEQEIGNQEAQADISISLNCPACSYNWQSNFDIQNYLWVEINAWAQSILQEVYVLAKNFGWSEESILSMTPQKRQLYLQMIFA